MVIAARGSGEGPADWQNLPAYTSDAYHGAGQTLYKMFADLKAASPLTFSLDPVVYRADSVVTLATHPAKYLSDAGMGEQGIVLDIQATDAQCGGTVRYILAGDSLGAWAVHDALHKLGPAQLKKIAGVALFGDPKFIPFQPIVRYDTLQDYAAGVAALAPEPQYDSIPPSLIPHTGSWCEPADPVCQAIGVPPATWAAEVAACGVAIQTNPPTGQLCAHLQYWTDGDTELATVFLNPFMPPASRWPKLTGAAPPDGTVGTPYTWAAAATPTGTYTWTSTGTLPPGLSFSSTGVLSGTPSQEGIFSFTVTATGSYGRFVTGEETVSINPNAGGGWGTAIEVPGTASLNAGGQANVYALSCASTGNCSAGGYDIDGSGHGRAFVADEVSGTWGNAVEVPGSGTLSGVLAVVQSLSCASAGNCSAGGYYTDGSGHEQAFVADEVNSTWGNAVEVPGIGTLNRLRRTGPVAVVCVGRQLHRRRRLYGRLGLSAGVRRRRG